MPHDTPIQPNLRSGREDMHIGEGGSGREDMHIGEGAEMTFRKPAGLADAGQRANALSTADSGRAIAETRRRGFRYVVERRS